MKRLLGLLGAAGSSTPALVPFVTDTFTGANATELSTHTGELGATWTKHTSYTGSGAASNVLIQNNRAYGQSANGVYYASGTPPSADYSVSADIVVLSNAASSGVCARIDTAANTFYCARYNFTTTKWELLKFVAGAATVLLDAAATLTVSQSYRLTLRCVGTTISMTVDGVVLASATDSAISAVGKAGIRMVATQSTITSYHLDNFQAAA